MKKILVVDDDQMLCRFACDILRTEGYHAVSAANAAEALAAFDREDFDLLVTSSHMPGMSGVELAQAVRGKIPGFPVIVMTLYVFGVLFEASMKITDMGDRLGDNLAIRLELEAQHPVSGGVLRPHVQGHDIAAVLYLHRSS